MGPVQLFLIGFDDFQATGRIVDELAKLSEAGLARVLDARFITKDDDGEVIALRASELTEDERADLRAAAGALMGFGAGYALGGEELAEAGALFGAEAGWVGDQGFDDEDIEELGDDLERGEALLMLLLEQRWAEGLRDALRESGAVSVVQDFVTPEGLVALGALLGAAAED